jgi:hypothetical protein
MDGLLRKFLFGTPEVTAIWLLLIALAILGALWLWTPGLRQRSREAASLRDATVLRVQRLKREAAESVRYAEEIVVAAQRAREVEQVRRAEWLRWQQEAEARWRQFEAASDDLRRVAFAGAFPLSEQSEEDTYKNLARAAKAACLRGELSPLELSEALRHQGAWDPHRHPADLEIVLRRCVYSGRQAAYHQIADREQAAWGEYATAADRARSLRDEACHAERWARESEQLLAVAVADRHTQRRWTLRASPVRRGGLA